MLIVRTTGGETVRWERQLVGYIDARNRFRTALLEFEHLDGKVWSHALSAKITKAMKAADAAQKARQTAPESPQARSEHSSATPPAQNATERTSDARTEDAA